jgi:hypothetical protein
MRAGLRLAPLALLLGACAAPRTAAPPVATPVPTAVPTVTLPFAMDEARSRTEVVAVRCWLDPVLAGAVMLVDRQTGEITVTDDDALLLGITFQAATGGTGLTMTGTAMDDPARAARLDADLRTVARGDAAC